MLTDEVRSEVEHAPATKKLSFVVYVRADEVLATVRQLPDVKARAQALTDMYRAAKAPLIASVIHCGALRVVDPLDGTPNVLLSGPAKDWKRLFADNDAVSQDPRFEIMPNSGGWATTP